MKKRLILIPLLTLALVVALITTVVGCTGEPGLKGDQGPMGLQGIQGEQGERGLAGPQGKIGLQGEPGLQGVMGKTGAKGATGPTGPAGAPGEQGEQGERGPSGSGARGATGAKGATGATGPKGDKGDPGVCVCISENLQAQIDALEARIAALKARLDVLEFVPPTIDGVLGVGEWDDYYLGTSVTSWEGGMSVDVYGFADDTYLYAAYIADTTQPGWAVTTSMGISANPAYWTPSTTEWPDEGYTILGFGGDGIGQTDGEGWNFEAFGGWGIQDGEWADIEYYVGDPCYNPGPNSNVMELKIPLSLLTYAGDNHFVGLGGQYWQYDSAEPFLVMLPL